MNILFMTMAKIPTISQRGIYTDLMRKFRKEGHVLYIVTPTERRDGRKTTLAEQDGVHLLSVRTLNVQKTNVIEKGFGQVSIGWLYRLAIRKYFGKVKFDLILYSTPPITFNNAIAWAKRQNPSAKGYLMLKDIFPQNAVDLGMLSKTGLKGILYKFFRGKERKLYALSDYIGCTSPANVRYVIEHNPEVDVRKVEICPNSVEFTKPTEQRSNGAAGLLGKYGLPTDKPIIIYGGNLGMPQCIPFLIKCLDANKDRKDCHFLVVGNGFEYPRLEAWYKKQQPKSVTVMAELPKEDYDRLVRACHVGLICLDYRFTIPNFPCRILSYLENKMPVLVCTDPNCDEGTIATENNFGVWCPSNSVEAFTKSVDTLLVSDIKAMGENGYNFLCENYLVENSYDAIMKHFLV